MKEALRYNGFWESLLIFYDFIFHKKAKCRYSLKILVSNKSGIEVGGPSEAFSSSGILPVYPYITSLDSCNFSKETVWQKDDGRLMVYEKFLPGIEVGEIVAEATCLKFCSNHQYDFLLASHVLEHLANPLKALREWYRVLKPDGQLIVIVPRKNRTFDHLRPITTFEHLVEDFNCEVSEDDLTHLEEVFTFHDLKRDPEAGDFTVFKQRSENNLVNRCLHHHVFDKNLLAGVLQFAGFELVALEAVYPLHILALARRL